MCSNERLQAFEEKLIQELSEQDWAHIFAWRLLPNHYHILASVNLTLFEPWLRRIHNGTSTRWNREDRTPGRKVWYHFIDRIIRTDRHYWATINYIHANPVKHDYVSKATEWPYSSLHGYLRSFGKDKVSRIYKQYPVKDYGKGWDWDQCFHENPVKNAACAATTNGSFINIPDK
ncbi:MAG: hypothetical protein GKR87_13330 [Kiritimatiellae bacterium]|nr:hypothetical protein [Kiritimatiellia bacterium]